ncbi:MAG: GNAT family protein [Steroidobacteraceae bacterium]|jgi:RimJ/RimL family protein N-acetyltransferase
MAWLEPICLHGADARLEPLAMGHLDDLIESVNDGELWNLWYTTIPRPEGMRAEIERRLALQAAGSMMPFAVVDVLSGKAVGMTTYMHIDAVNRRLEIGSTWMRRSVQRTLLNTQVKLVLLRHAFETLGCIGVEFRTHFLNQQSRRAIERLGAKLDGVLRQHQRAADGSLRDTCVYSVIASEWPGVKSHLNWQLSKPRE